MLAIDHLVIATSDPERAAKNFENKYGVKPVQGGKHESWGTYNFLAYLANDCYIEWIGIFDEVKARKSTNPLIKQLVETLQHGNEGFFQIAFRTGKMDQVINKFNDKQIPYTGPIEGSRKRPDGTLLEWRMLFPFPKAKSHELYPFLIEWGRVNNQPDDPRYINRHQLQMITINKQLKDKFTTAYGLKYNGGKIQLTNAIIQFSEEKHLQFRL